MKPILSALVVCSLLSACSSSPKRPLPPPLPPVKAPAKAAVLSQEEAVLRAKQIRGARYGLWFGLDSKSTEYEGRAVIHFTVRPKGKDISKVLAIDFEGGAVRTLSLNGVAIAQPQFDGHRILVPTKDLMAGGNRVEVSFTHPFSEDGNGFYRFKDPVDGLVYLYSNFEPYFAHEMFPCFDQPDLKASYELSVSAPAEWQVISNTLERETAKEQGGRKTWAFPPSPVFSTYVFALHAGPFASRKSTANGIPLRLFSRKSLSQHVDFREWFDITAKGLEHYSVHFGYPYPYSKYDQVIVPDFNSTAMENVAAVTFGEEFVFRTQVPADTRRARANIILHEMAHMWFGNLVTMKWWNGLWLNESFASYASTVALADSSLYKNAWQSFFAGSKRSAYQEDKLVTTHPVEVPIEDTGSASANFDSITYGKGASVLKQLAFYIGEDDFKEGVQRYFQNHALKNTTLADFLKSLKEASDKDLTQWQKLWLRTTGPNTLRAQWACEDGKVSRFSLLQGGTPLRPHKTKVALYRHSSTGKLTTSETVETIYTQAETQVPALVGKACPDFVFPNEGDQDYVEVELDPVSLQAAETGLKKLDSPLTRLMTWHTLWEMVEAGKLPPLKYAQIALKQGVEDSDTQILKEVLDTLIHPSPHHATVLKYLPVDGKSGRSAFRSRIETAFLKGLQEAAPGSDAQKVWFGAFTEIASKDTSLDFVQHLFDSKQKLRGFVVDQEARWTLLRALARGNRGGPVQLIRLITAEAAKDDTDMGHKAAIAAEVSIPDSQSKNDWLNRILQPLSGQGESPLSLAKLEMAMWNYQSPDQEDLMRSSADLYFDWVTRLTDPTKEEFAQNFADALYPAICDPQIVRKTSEVLAANSKLLVSVAKTLKSHKQLEERCISARKANSGESPSL